MKVKSILIAAAQLIGLNSAVEYLQGDLLEEDTERKAEADKLLTAYNAVLSDLATDYFPLIHTLVAENAQELPFSVFSDRPLEVISVCDGFGYDLQFAQTETAILLNKSVSKVVVKYRYLPKERKIEDECDYGYFDLITPRVISMGVASEYLAESGAFKQSAEWKTKFESGLRACLRPKGKLVMPRRRWQ